MKNNITIISFLVITLSVTSSLPSEATYVISGSGNFGGGNNVTSSGDSFALGGYNYVPASFSVACGYYCYATGAASFAAGANTEASGTQSAAFNYDTWASGDFSTAFGYLTFANAYGDVVIGQYNIGAVNTTYNGATTWFAGSGSIPADPVLEIGNGTSGTNTSNALTVYKNGNATFQGAVRCSPGGDLSMGSFTAGTHP